MSPTIRCEHCGSTVRFEDEDRGFEVYCPSCARGNWIPDSTSELPASSVFSDETTDELRQQVIGKETCLCGKDVPVRVEDHGSTVYCPSCGTEIQVGRSLDGGKYRVVRAGSGEADEPTPGDEDGEPAAGQCSPGRVGVDRRHAVAWTLVVLSVTVGYLAWATPGWLLWPSRGPGDITGPFVVPPSGGAPSIPPEGGTTNGPEAQITLAEIGKLVEFPDPMEALLEARIWHSAIAGQELAEDDPRLAKLAKVIEMLEAKLRPPPDPPAPAVIEFRAVVCRLADSLKAGDLAAARKFRGAAENLLLRHPDLLAPYRHRFAALKQRLEQEEKFGAAAGRIEDLLERAGRLQEPGQVTEAVEAECEARFLALTTLLTDAEAKTLDAKQRQLASKLRLARGRRAVRDAQRGVAAGDRRTRDREVRRALTLLPGLPESQAVPLLKQVEPWVEQARCSEDGAESGAKTSEIAREIEVRDCYEAVWEYYAAADCEELAAACRRLQGLMAEGEPHLEAKCRRAEELLFDVLDYAIRERLNARGSDDSATDRAGQASEARQLLDDAKFWRASPRWQELDALVRDCEPAQPP